MKYDAPTCNYKKSCVKQLIVSNKTFCKNKHSCKNKNLSIVKLNAFTDLYNYIDFLQRSEPRLGLMEIAKKSISFF